MTQKTAKRITGTAVVPYIVAALMIFALVYTAIQPNEETVQEREAATVVGAATATTAAIATAVATTTTVKSTGKVVSSPEMTPLQERLQKHKKSLTYHGNKKSHTGWFVDSLCLKGKKSLLVYGVGCGVDISWDVGLVNRYNATVHMFDPTPRSIQYTAPYIAKFTKTQQLTHTPEGLSDQPGTMTFAVPDNPAFVSMRSVDLAQNDMTFMSTRTIDVPVNTLQAWMQQRGHKYLDVLKIDIEGTEYPVLESLLAQKFMPFTQLLVEFHDRFIPDKERHGRLLQALEQAGFVALWTQQKARYVNYVKIADLDYCEDGVSPRVA